MSPISTWEWDLLFPSSVQSKSELSNREAAPAAVAYGLMSAGHLMLKTALKPSISTGRRLFSLLPQHLAHASCNLETSHDPTLIMTMSICSRPPSTPQLPPSQANARGEKVISRRAIAGVALRLEHCPMAPVPPHPTSRWTSPAEALIRQGELGHESAGCRGRNCPWLRGRYKRSRLCTLLMVNVAHAVRMQQLVLAGPPCLGQS